MYDEMFIGASWALHLLREEALSLLTFILLPLIVLTMITSGLGYDPLATLFPNLGAYALPSVLGLALFGLLLYRSHHLETQLRDVLERLEATPQPAAAPRDRELAAETQQLTSQVQALSQQLVQHEQLLPGRFMLLQQHYDEAVKILQEALASQPENPEARWLVGEALFRTKRYVEALPHLLAGLSPRDAQRLTLVAQCEQTLGRYAEAEQHLLQLIEIRGELRQDDLVVLGSVQGELDPERGRQTLAQALELNPYNSVARYQLIELESRVEAYERVITLASEGLARNPSDVGCYVSRAEALFRRGRAEDEARMLDDLATAQARNRRDYNIYRLRAALYLRRASQVGTSDESRQALQAALDAYQEGLRNVPPKFRAHLLAAESRVLLQLRRFTEAVQQAQRAVEHYPGHVSNHLALAFARLAARQWQAAVQAAERGMQWAGWGGRIWLTAIIIFATAFESKHTFPLCERCASLAEALNADCRHFALSENWSVIREVLHETMTNAPEASAALVSDTIALLESTLTPETYRQRWGSPRSGEGEKLCTPA
jgi:tetratricopeptide (TPR) repeat protein